MGFKERLYQQIDSTAGIVCSVVGFFGGSLLVADGLFMKIKNEKRVDVSEVLGGIGLAGMSLMSLVNYRASYLEAIANRVVANYLEKTIPQQK